jgi:hypothetical protein
MPRESAEARGLKYRIGVLEAEIDDLKRSGNSFPAHMRWMLDTAEALVAAVKVLSHDTELAALAEIERSAT